MDRTEHRGSRRAELREALRSQWWGHLLIAGTLTVVFNGQGTSAGALLYVFAANLLLSTSIGSVITVLYVFVWGTVLIDGGVFKRAAVHGITIIVGVLLGTEAAIACMKLGALAGFEVSVQRAGVWRVGLAVSVVAIIASIAYDRLRERVRVVELREQHAQQALLEAQFENLQAKVNPHFLFNALNTVASVVEEDADDAVEAVEQLSSLLRRSLERNAHGLVPVHDEVDAVRSYLALERRRFGSRLHADVIVDPSVRNVPVPPFVVQPLVENAVKHGIAARREGGSITVEIGPCGDGLRLLVHDDGPGSSSTPGTQTGHETLKKRLALQYGGAATFSAGPGQHGGYRVEITLPAPLDTPAGKELA